MADYAKTAAGVLEGVGGEENVTSLVHCMTRLRFVLKDESKAHAAAIKAVPGVITTAQAGGQYQVVIGNDVPEVYAEIGKISRIGGATPADQAAAAPEDKGNLFNRFIKMISSIFTPVLWALAGTGLLKAFLSAAVTFSWIDPAGSTYLVLNALSDAFINFLPLALSITPATSRRRSSPRSRSRAPSCTRRWSPRSACPTSRSSASRSRWSATSRASSRSSSWCGCRATRSAG